MVCPERKKTSTSVAFYLSLPINESMSHKNIWISGRFPSRNFPCKKGKQSWCRESQWSKVKWKAGDWVNHPGTWPTVVAPLLLISRQNTVDHVLITNETQTPISPLQGLSIFQNWTSRGGWVGPSVFYGPIPFHHLLPLEDFNSILALYLSCLETKCILR